MVLFNAVFTLFFTLVLSMTRREAQLETGGADATATHTQAPGTTGTRTMVEIRFLGEEANVGTWTTSTCTTASGAQTTAAQLRMDGPQIFRLGGTTS